MFVCHGCSVWFYGYKEYKERLSSCEFVYGVGSVKFSHLLPKWCHHSTMEVNRLLFVFLTALKIYIKRTEMWTISLL